MQGIRPIRTALSLAAVVTLSAACSSMEEEIERTQADIDAAAEQAEGLEVGQTLARDEPRLVKDRETLWLGLDERESVREIPPALQKDFAVKETFDSVIAIAEHVSLTTGIPVNVSPDAIADLAFEELREEMQERAAQSDGSQTGPLGLAGAGGQPVPGGGSDTNQIRFEADYQGDLAGFFDAVAARYNIDWRYREGRVNFFRYGTETFTIETLPGIASGATGIEGNAGEDSASTLSAQFNVQNLDVWADLRDTVTTMLSGEGLVTISPSIGKLTVTDIPANLRRVEDYIEEQNRALAKSVTVDITVVSLSLRASERFGVDWSVVTESLAENMTGTVDTGTPSNGLFSLSLDGDFGPATTGSEAFIDALSTQGDVSVVTGGSVTTLNNRPAPIRSGRTTTFLAAEDVTVTDNTTQSQLTPGEFSTGFNAKVLPHILPNNDILLEYGVNLRNLVELAEISSADGTRIQAPDIAVDEFVQQTRIGSGETMVTGGFLQDRAEINREGVGAASNVLAGGVNSERVQDRIFIIIEPVLQD